MKRQLSRYAFLGALLLLLLVLTACPGGGSGTLPPPSPSEGLSISAPVAEQTLSGTIAVAAAGIGGKAENLVFILGELEVQAEADGTAVLNTRALADGAYTLEASASVSGRQVSDSLSVTVMNELPSSGTVGPEGGALKSEAGSLAVVPPGAVDGSVSLSVTDLSREEILAEFGIDYEALGITFLGALDIEAEGAEASNLPLQVDLAGWAEAVQPGQGVLMFSLAPDTDGDGIGELMMAAEAMATEDGSVITRPVPKTEVYGLETISGSSLGVQQTSSVRPGELFTLSTRGFLIGGALSNVARFEGAPDILARPTLAESSSFNPLMTLQVAAPALGAGTHGVRFKNLSSGYLSDQVDISIDSLGTGDAETWNAFVSQSRTAIERLSSGRSELLQLAEPWLEALAASGSSTASAMANNSSLVSAANRDLLEAIGSSYSSEQRALVWEHALLLDAIAISVPELEQSAADLAALLVVTVPAEATSTSGGLRTLQGDTGGGCLSPGSEIFGPTGMGSGPPPGGPGCGSGAGGGSGGSNLSTQRLGSFGPVEGAIVRIIRRGTSGKLSPFTALTDEAGYYHIPFIPEGEPFTVWAIDPRTGHTATANGVGVPLGQSVSVPLVFAPTAEPGAPTASFTITPVPDPDFEGSVYYEFDVSASSDEDGKIEEYIWDFDGFSKSLGDTSTVRRGFGRNSSYTIRLTVLDDEGKAGTTAQELVIDDLPYDYWGTPPVHIDRLADGSAHGSEAERDGFAISADGRYVAFSIGQYDGGDLLPEDTNGERDVYRKDLNTGALELVSEAAAGVETGVDVSMSHDGRYVAYMSQETSDGGRWRVHVRDMDTGALTTIAVADTDLQLTPASLSGDGRTLLYEIQWSLSQPASEGAYVRDLDEGSDIRLEVPETGAIAQAVALSANGTHALISTSYGGLYVVDLDTLIIDRASENADGVAADASVQASGPAISADGRFVVFLSEATNLVAEPKSEYRDHAYLKDMETGEVRRVSRNQLTGAEGSGNSRQPVITSDGRYVFFPSYAENLTPVVQKTGPDFGGCSLQQCPTGMIYAYEVASGRLALAEVGFDHSTPCCSSSSERLIAVADQHLAFSSYNEQLVTSGDDDTMRIFRAENPLWEP